LGELQNITLFRKTGNVVLLSWVSVPKVRDISTVRHSKCSLHSALLFSLPQPSFLVSLSHLGDKHIIFSRPYALLENHSTFNHQILLDAFSVSAGEALDRKRIRICAPHQKFTVGQPVRATGCDNGV
jgi:hypothetical protein